jgi:hypothetical protein
MEMYDKAMAVKHVKEMERALERKAQEIREYKEKWNIDV